MEFWGVEVKSGEPLKVQPGDDKILHLSQASLGEAKNNANESIPLFVKIGGQKLVLGTLSPVKFTQLSFDLVFEKEFELSHNWKNGSVYFCGYRSVISDEAGGFTDSDSEFEEDLPLLKMENGKAETKDEKTKANAAKPISSEAKPKVNNKEVVSSDDSDSDDSEEDDEDMLGIGGESSSDDEESSDESDEEPPKKAEPGKKRPLESATKTPAPEKKAKLVTPQTTGSTQKNALQSHKKVKHGGK